MLHDTMAVCAYHAMLRHSIVTDAVCACRCILAVSLLHNITYSLLVRYILLSILSATASYTQSYVHVPNMYMMKQRV